MKKIVSCFLLLILISSLTNVFLKTANSTNNDISPIKNVDAKLPSSNIPEIRTSQENWDLVNYTYRFEVNISTDVELYNYPVELFINFSRIGIRPHVNAVRVVDNGQLIPFQIWNSSVENDHYNWFTITFAINQTAYSTKTIYIYFDTREKEAISFPSFVSYQIIDQLNNIYSFSGDNYRNAETDPAAANKLFDIEHIPGDIRWQDNWGDGYGFEGVEGFHYSPRATVSTVVIKLYSPSNVRLSSIGPHFIKLDLINAPLEYASYIFGYANISYRFFRWGWFLDVSFEYTYPTAIPFDEFYLDWFCFEYNAFSTIVYGNNPNSPNFDTIKGLTDWPPTGQTYDDYKFFGFFNISSGHAAGSVVLNENFIGTSYSAVYSELYRIKDDHEGFKRTFADVTMDSGDQILAHYAIYIWDATADDEASGFSPFQTFIKMFVSPPQITTPKLEIYKIKVPIRLTDLEGYPIASAQVTLKNETMVFGSGITDSTGLVTLSVDASNDPMDVIVKLSTYTKTYEFTFPDAILANGSEPVLSEQVFLLPIHSVIFRIYSQNRTTDLASAVIEIINKTSGETFMNTTSDDDGWIFTYLPEGTWKIVAYFLNSMQTFTVYNATISDASPPNDFNSSVQDTPLVISNSSFTFDCNSKIRLLIELDIVGNPSYLDIVEGSTYYEVEWGELIFLKISLTDKNRNPIDINEISSATVNWTILDAKTGNPITGFVSEKMNYEGNGIFNLTLNTSKLYANKIYILKIYGNLGDQYLPPDPLQIPITVNPVKTFLEIINVPDNIYYAESLSIQVRYITTTDVDIPDANITITIGNFSYTLHQLEDGSYSLTISTFTDLTPGYYKMVIEASKLNFTSQEKVRFIMINNRPTDFKLYHRNIEVMSIEMFYRPSTTIEVEFLDTINNSYIAGATGSLVVKQFIDPITPVVVYKIDLLWNSSNNRYYALINISSFGTGFYTIEIILQKQFYQMQVIRINFIVKPVLTKIFLHPAFTSIYWGDLFNYTINVYDIETGDGIPNLEYGIEVWFNTEKLPGVPDAIKITELGNGTYTVSVDSGKLEVGIYDIKIQFMKSYYEFDPVYLKLRVDKIPVKITVETSSLVNLNPINGHGTSKVLISLEDIALESPMSGANISIKILGTEKEFYATEIYSGVYEVVIDWSGVEPGDYSFSVIVNEIVKRSYKAKAIDVIEVVEVEAISSTTKEELHTEISGNSIQIQYISVDYPLGSVYIPGVGRAPVVIIGPVFGAVIASVGALIYKEYQWRKLPIEVRELIKLMKEIKKGIYEYSSPERHEIFKELVAEALGLA